MQVPVTSKVTNLQVAVAILFKGGAARAGSLIPGDCPRNRHLCTTKIETKMESYTDNKITGELPRLTGSLRVFSNVFSDQESCLPSDTSALLERKREKRKEAGLSHSKTWSQVSSSILKSVNRQDTSKVRHDHIHNDNGIYMLCRKFDLNRTNCHNY